MMRNTFSISTLAGLTLLCMLSLSVPHRADAVGLCGTIQDPAQQQACQDTCSQSAYPDADKNGTCQAVYAGCVNAIAGDSAIWQSLETFGQGYGACKTRAISAATSQDCTVTSAGTDSANITEMGRCNPGDTNDTITTYDAFGNVTKDNGTSKPSASTPLTPSCQGSSCNLTYQPLEPLPSGFSGQPSADTYSGLAGYLNYLFPILIAAGALFSVLMITVSGVEYMVSAAVGEKAKALERIRAALWGLLLLIGSVLILRTINPQLVVFNLQSLGQLGTEAKNTAPVNGALNPSVQTTVAPGTAQPAQAIPQSGAAPTTNVPTPKPRPDQPGDTAPASDIPTS